MTLRELIMYTLLQKKLAGLEAETAAFAHKLVATPSVSFDEGQIASKVKSELESLGYDKVVQDEYGNVVGVLFGRESDPSVLLTSHMDTVVPSTADGWQSDPYSARLEDGRLYGLGATDCKGGLAAQVYAGALLKRSLLPLRGTVVFAATVAEANGRSVGVRGLMESTLSGLGIEPSFALLGEPTGLGLYYGHDGWVELSLVVNGKNPVQVDRAVRALEDSWNYPGKEPITVSSAVEPRVLDVRLEEVEGARRATLTLNRRLTEDGPVEAVVDQVRREAQRAAGDCDAAVEVSIAQERERLYTGNYQLVRNLASAWSIDPYDPLVERSRQALSAAGINVRPRRWEFGRFGMGTAGGTLVNEFNLPTVAFGPGEEEQAHRADEYVEMRKVVQAVYGTAVIVHGLVGVPVFGWTSDEI